MTSPVLSVPGAPRHVHAHVADEAWMGEQLQAVGLLAPEHVEQVLRLQEEQGLRFGEAAVRLGLVTQGDVEFVLARQFGYPCARVGEAALAPQLVTAYEPFGAQAEAVRAVRSQLMLRWLARDRRALALLGAMPGDGVSTFAANLALSFAQLGQSTLLVDANLREPRQHALFGAPAGPGLSDLLAGRAELGTLERIPGFDDLTLLPAGTQAPNPAELLGRPSLRTLAAQMEARYDVVLYDVPAFTRAADALAVAACAGGALMVVRQNHTALADIGRMAAALGDAGADVVGSVMVAF